MIIGISGFESGLSTAEPINSFSGLISLNSSHVLRTGNYCLQVNPTDVNTASARFGKWGASGVVTSFDIADLYVRMDFWYTDLTTTGDEPLFQSLTAGSVVKLEVRFDYTSGNLKVYVNQGADLVATGSTVLAPETKYVLSFRSGTNVVAPGWEILIDGASELSDSVGQLQSGNNGYFRIGKAANRNGQSVFYFADNVAWGDEGFPPAGLCKALIPVANGSTMQWTGGTGAQNYTQIDEIPPAGGDYVLSQATNDVALFAFQDTGDVGISGTPNAVMLVTQTRENVTGTSAYAARIKSGITNLSTSASDQSTTNTQIGIVTDTDPNTGLAWTLAAIDALEAGAADTGTARMRLNWAMITVDYTPAAGGGTSVPLLNTRRFMGA